MFGDGYIGNGTTNRPFSIKSIDREFINHIQNDIESCTNFKTHVRFMPEHYSCGCHHKDAWEFQIASHPYFNKKYHFFYNDYRKRIISSEAIEWITPQGLANWYMGDGYVCLVGKTKGEIRSRRIDICTDRYSKSDVEKLQEMFSRRFGINTSVIKRNNTYRLRVLLPSYSDFFYLIYPYMIPSMMYKLYLGYEAQPKWMDDYMWKIQEDLRSAIALPDNAEGKDIV